MQQHVTLSPIHDGTAVTGMVVTIEDVTTRLDREREVAQQLRSTDETTRLNAALAASFTWIAGLPGAWMLGVLAAVLVLAARARSD